MTEHEHHAVSPELTELLSNRREVITFRVVAALAIAMACAAMLTWSVVAYRAKTDSDNRLKELSAQLNCRSDLRDKVADAQAGIDIDLAAAIAAILAADRQALSATAPGLKRESENLQAAREELNKSELICPSSDNTE